jgi:glycosyltransferase involved in cell wall biosynthesis
MSPEIKYDDIPKVLIFGQSFNLNSGGGITLSNTFKFWPIEKIAFISYNIDDSIAKKYKHYHLGTKELRHPFPFNFFQSFKISGTVKTESANNSNKSNRQNKILLKFKYHYFSFLQITGVFNRIDRITLSQDLLGWINDYDPDIIYTQLSNLALIESTLALMNILNKKLVIHIMDDWPSTINRAVIRKKYWQNYIEKRIKEVFNSADLLLSICEPMSNAYKKRYNKRFIPFHNSIDIERWLASSRTKWDLKDRVQILYAGRIGFGTSSALIDIAEAIQELNSEGFSVNFNIQTGSIDNPIYDKLKKINCVKINPYIEYHDLPNLFAKADILILPIDFDNSNLKFIKLSMPTKVPEYMITGTPIFIYSPSETALVEYAAKDKWAQLLSDNSIEKIKQNLKQLITDENLRKSLGTRAKQTAMKNHDNSVVTKNFMGYLSHVTFYAGFGQPEYTS